VLAQYFNKMDEMSKACTKESRPEFAELLEAFKEQLNYMDENSSIINEKVNTIKDLHFPEKEPSLEEIQSSGVLGELWGCVAKMREYNNTLNESKKSLVRFIG
jgi:hypothetical protein